MSKLVKVKDTKQVIKDFIKHVDDLEAVEDPEGNGFHKEYRWIQEEQVKNRQDNIFPMEAGKSNNNLRKNRYKDILPYDEHRVTLTQFEGEEDSDYINASKLMGVNGTGGYIASQGPLAATVNDFWRMIWEKNVEIVFMACRIVEMGKIKCKQYWNDVGKSDEFGDITVFTESEEEPSSDFIWRIFKVKKGDEERRVIQFHYSGWPDHGIPNDPAHIRDLIGIMREARKNHKAPLLVHCSAGCGRTGAIIAIDFVWTLLEQGSFDEEFSLYELIRAFRRQRMSIVQTVDQYALVYKVLKSLCEDWVTKMASHTYVNVELDNKERSVNAEGTNGTAQPPEDNIYEESWSFRSKAPMPAPTFEQKKQTGPEVVDLQLKENSPGSAAYEKLVATPKTPSPTGAGNNEKQVHTTFIRVGSAHKQVHVSSTGGREEVTYVVETSASKTASAVPPKRQIPPAPSSTSSIPPLATISLPDSAVYSEVHKGSKVDRRSAPVHSPTKSAFPDGVEYTAIQKGPSSHQAALSHSPGKVLQPPGDVYAVVNKGGKGGLEHVLPVGTPPTRHYSNIETGETAHNTGARNLSTSAMERADHIYSSVNTAKVSGKPVAKQAPGFNQRLPQVRGPVPMPQSWNKS